MAVEFTNPQAIQFNAVTHYVGQFLDTIREHIDDEVMQNTPARVARALDELTSGYRESPKTILAKRFKSDCDEMVMVRDIAFQSLCAHHLLPFTGTAIVAYVPNGEIVGLSKLPRLVHCYSRRLQVQEQLTNLIADAIDNELKPKGVGVIMRGEHTCMALRGVRCDGTMITSALRGVVANDARARAEFISLAQWSNRE